MTNPFVPVYTELTDEQKEQVKRIKDKAMALYEEIATAFSADMRCVAIAKTELETAVMWAVKGVTNPPLPCMPGKIGGVTSPAK